MLLTGPLSAEDVGVSPSEWIARVTQGAPLPLASFLTTVSRASVSMRCYGYAIASDIRASGSIFVSGVNWLWTLSMTPYFTISSTRVTTTLATELLQRWHIDYLNRPAA